MKAIQLTAYGNPVQSLELVELSLPKAPAASEVLVRIVPDIKALGIDFVGVDSPELSKQIQGVTGGAPIQLGLDAVGGPATATIANILSPGAHLVVYAWLSGTPIHVGQCDLIVKRLSIHGF